ncbi:TBC1 domain family member 17-like isoform X2 [Paramacrobiotus metropolitanus]|uniref:TBC1 domain family member 17-like isoform X2 n=1 Tax=Paramacrobiotus metropolitanus TaxID=2943436 RepID=UPI00244640BE|nr:TBC1 domain family member 17-like isoform X2 [Paramacrobiotus metropolitanus]
MPPLRPTEIMLSPENNDIIKSWADVSIIIPKHPHGSGAAVPEKVFGVLQIVSKDRFGTYLEWTPSMESLLSEDGTYKAQSSCTVFTSKDGSYRIPHISIDIDDIKCFKISGGECNPQKVVFITNDGTSHPTLEIPEEIYNALVAFLQTRLLLERSAKDANLCLVRDRRRARKRNDPYEMPEQSPHFLQRFARSPVTTAFLGLSKVHNLLMNAVDVLAPPLAEPEMARPYPEYQMPPLGVLQSREDQDFEKPPLELPPRPPVARRGPLTAQEWNHCFDKDGRISDENALRVKEIIFRGGVDPSIRKDVWKYLLGYYEWNASLEERQERRQGLMDDYYRMKNQWSTISAEQERRFSVWRERKDLIEKDVHRTDRTHPFFEGKSAALKVMNELLLTYCMLNFDLGYVQGMSDLLTPVYVVMDGDEVDTFWTFNGLLEHVTHNFEMSKLMYELEEMATIMKYLDPSLKAYMDSNDPKMYFCFRWLLVQFKREFSFDDVMRLWEIFWTGFPCKNFHLLFGYAILEVEKNTIVENKFSSTEILRHINDLSMNIDLERTLKLAESIYHQLMGAEELPTSIRKIIGLATASETSNTQDYSPETPLLPLSKVSSSSNIRDRSPQICDRKRQPSGTDNSIM